MVRILVTIIAHQVLGFIWYSDSAFGPRWVAALGNVPLAPSSATYVISIVSSIAYVLVLRNALILLNVKDWRVGANIGTYVGVVFGMGTLATHYSFLGLNLELAWIDGGREIVVGFLSGILLTQKNHAAHSSVEQITSTNSK